MVSTDILFKNYPIHDGIAAVGDFTELLAMLSTMSSFRKDSFELADYFNANSERMLRLSIAAGTFLAGQFQKQQVRRGLVDAFLLRTV